LPVSFAAPAKPFLHAFLNRQVYSIFTPPLALIEEYVEVSTRMQRWQQIFDFSIGLLYS